MSEHIILYTHFNLFRIVHQAKTSAMLRKCDVFIVQQPSGQYVAVVNGHSAEHIVARVFACGCVLNTVTNTMSACGAHSL